MLKKSKIFDNSLLTYMIYNIIFGLGVFVCLYMMIVKDIEITQRRRAIVRKVCFIIFFIIIGVFIGGFGFGYNYLGLNVSEFVIAFFSITTAYFAMGQVNYAKLQHEFNLVSKDAKLVIEHEEGRDYLLIKNMGDSSAVEVDCEITNMTTGDVDNIETIDYIEGQCFFRYYIPFAWRNESCIIEISLNYEATQSQKTSKWNIEYEP